MSESGTYVYIITQNGSDFPCKIGMSSDPWKRLSSLQAGSYNKLALREIYLFDTRAEAAAMERAFHESHVEDGMNGEWFGLTFEEANYWLFLHVDAPDIERFQALRAERA